MSANVPEIAVSSYWRNRVLLLALGIFAIIAILKATYTEIFHFWWTYSAYNHCILIVPITFYLIHDRR
ncbi:MAG: hypothetical protein AAF387_22340, partial [Pseudomonadota bacterium]